MLKNKSMWAWTSSFCFCSWPWPQCSVSCPSWARPWWQETAAAGGLGCSSLTVFTQAQFGPQPSCCGWPWLLFADSVHTSTVLSTAKLLQAALAAVHWQCSHKHSFVHSQVAADRLGCSPMTILMQAQFCPHLSCCSWPWWQCSAHCLSSSRHRFVHGHGIAADGLGRCLATSKSWKVADLEQLSIGKDSWHGLHQLLELQHGTSLTSVALEAVSSHPNKWMIENVYMVHKTKPCSQ